MKVVLALAALAAVSAVHVDVDAALSVRVNDDIEEIRQKLFNANLPDAAKQNAFANLNQMQEDVQELELETSPDKAEHLKKAIQLRLAVLNQQLSEEAETDDRVSDDIERLRNVIYSSDLSSDQRQTALANLDKIQDDVAEISTSTPERKEELKEALQLRLAALNHQLGTEFDEPLGEEQPQPTQEDEDADALGEMASQLLAAILPNMGDGDHLEIELPFADEDADAERQRDLERVEEEASKADAEAEACEEMLATFPLLAGGLRCPIHHPRMVDLEEMQQQQQQQEQQQEEEQEDMPMAFHMFPFGASPAFAPQQQASFEPSPMFANLPFNFGQPTGFAPLHQLPVHLQSLAESEPFHLVEHAAVGRQPMVLKMEEKDGFNVITGWFPGVAKANMRVRLVGDSLHIDAAVTEKDDPALAQDNMFHFDLTNAQHVDEELELPYAPSANVFKAHFNDEKHTFVAVFPLQADSVDITLQ